MKGGNIVDEGDKTLTQEPVATASKRVQKFSPKKRGYGATSITLAISAEDKKIVKMYALHKDMTVSDLLHEWIGEHCGQPQS